MPNYCTVTAKPSFDAEVAAKSFHTAFKGLGTDEKRVIKELTEHTNEQRQEIKLKYLTMYGKSLEQDLKSELGGELEQVAVALLMPRYDYDAHNLKKAIKGIGTDEKLIIEIVCTKESHELESLKKAYSELYKSNLEQDLAAEENGNLGRLFRSIISASRPSTFQVDAGLAQQEAQELYDAGVGKFGTDESEFIRILASRSFSQLRATFEAYGRIAGKDIVDSIKSETSGTFEDALVAIVESVRNRPAYFAKQLESAMKGVGTKDESLIRIIVSRSEVDMIEVRREYQKIFSHSLYDQLKKELSGDYEAIILKLVGKD